MTSVVVPSFGRPTLLLGCLTALAAQQQLPSEVIVAVRRGDDTTVSVVDGKEDLPFETRLVTIDEPGHIPPLAAGVAVARGEIVLFCDDDAEPWPGWVTAVARHYADLSVGGVGGLVVEPGFEDRLVAKHIGRISRSGRIDRLYQHRIPREWKIREVHALRGTNMSFRRDVIRRYPWDMRLNRGAATDFEISLSAWVRAQGYRILYDPDAAVTHHLGPRPQIGREPNAEAIRDYSHNLVYVSATALPAWQRVIAVIAAFTIGSRQSYGVATAIGDALSGRPPSMRQQLIPALLGKLAGLRSAVDYARSGPTSPAAAGPRSV
jgi:GT2 family glycosyltransferase